MKIDVRFMIGPPRTIRPLTQLDPVTWMERLFASDLGSIFDGRRFSLKRLAGDPKSVRALEAHLNANFDRFWDIEPAVLARWSIADLMAEHLDERGGVRLDLLRGQFGTAIDALLKEIGLSSNLVDGPAATPVRSKDPDVRGFAPEQWFANSVRLPHLDILKLAAIRSAAEIEPMPVVEKVAERFGTPQTFDQTALFASQHLLGSTWTMLRTMVRKLGLLPTPQMTVAGRSYSTAGIVHRIFEEPALTESGRRPEWVVEDLKVSHGLPGRGDWRPAIDDGYTITEHQRKTRMLLWRWATRIGLPTPQRFPLEVAGREFAGTKPFGPRPQVALIIDDGAENLVAANEDPVFGAGSGQVPRIVGVEQTTFGRRRLVELADAGKLLIPVIDVAGSVVKRELESVIIGWSVTQEISAILEGLEQDGLERGRKFATIGYGNVGRATARMLRDLHGYEVEVIEPDPIRRALAEQDGFTVVPAKPGAPNELDEAARRAALGAADYIVGATGTSSLIGSDFRSLKPGAVLFSASSSSVEFSASPDDGVSLLNDQFTPLIQTRQQHWPEPQWSSVAHANFNGKRIAMGPIVDPVHWHRVARVARGRSGRGFDVLLANSGFPITFRGQIDPIRPRLIQLTRALLELGSIEAVKLPPGASGLIGLSTEGQLFIAREFMNDVRENVALPPPVRAMLDEAFDQVRRELDSTQS